MDVFETLRDEHPLASFRRFYWDYDTLPLPEKRIVLARDLNTDTHILCETGLGTPDLTGVVWLDKETGEIRHLLVHPLYRRCGIGRRLMDKCHILCPKTLHFRVPKTDERANNFFSSIPWLMLSDFSCSNSDSKHQSRSFLHYSIRPTVQ